LKVKKIKIIFLGQILIFIIFSNLTLFLNDTVAEKEGTKFTGEMICKDENIWTDDMWQFYKVKVGVSERVEVRLDYSGDLDLDLRVYWKRENVIGFNGFDLTHCDINNDNYKFDENSQLRTTNTEELGYPEKVEIYNPSYTREEDQIAYVLVFVYSGEGKSEYTLTSSKELILIDDDDVYDCNFVSLILILYIAAATVVVMLFSYYVYRRKEKITGAKEEKKRLKEQEKQEKAIKHFDLDTKIE